MKALTLCQPYAQLVVRGEKRVENRTWPTKYRGPLVIHAGKSRSWLEQGDEARFASLGDPLVYGAALGMAHLIDVLPVEWIGGYNCHRVYPWLAGDPHVSGPWCWILADVQRWPVPVPMAGAQGLWQYPETMEYPGQVRAPYPTGGPA